MKHFFFLTLGVLLCISCRKDKPEPVIETPPRLEVIWEQPINVLLKSSPLLPIGEAGQNPCFMPKLYEPMVCANAVTGKIVWSDSFAYISNITQHEVINNHLIVNDVFNMYDVDLQNGKFRKMMKWNIGGLAFEYSLATFGDYIYTSAYVSGQHPFIRTKTLFRLHYLSEERDTILNYSSPLEGYGNDIGRPTCWLNPAGDSIIVIPVADKYLASDQPPAGYNLYNDHLLAFNLRTQQIEWQMNNYGHTYEPDKIVIEGNLCWALGHQRLYCIDLTTRSIKWEVPVPTISGKPLIVDDIVLLNGTPDSGLFGIDKYTGSTVWFKSMGRDLIEFDPVGFEDKVYFTTLEYLWVLSARDGSVLYKEHFIKDFYKQQLYNGVIVDPVRRCIYTTDRIYMIAFKVPD